MPPRGGVNTCKDGSGVGVDGSKYGGLTCDGIAGNGGEWEGWVPFPVLQ